MGKTANLAPVQMTVIDTLHNEDKSQQNIIAYEAGCSQSTYAGPYS